jgi:hypothetical protein
MKLDFKEITTAWFNTVVHTAEQKKLADKRIEICLSCPYVTEIVEGSKWFLRCGACGCPLKAKVYTYKTYQNEEGSCPMGKWKEVEVEHLIETGKLKNNKNNKTII